MFQENKMKKLPGYKNLINKRKLEGEQDFNKNSLKITQFFKVRPDIGQFESIQNKHFIK